MLQRIAGRAATVRLLGLAAIALPIVLAAVEGNAASCLLLRPDGKPTLDPLRVDVDTDRRGVLIIHRLAGIPMAVKPELREDHEQMTCRIRVDCDIETTDLKSIAFELHSGGPFKEIHQFDAVVLKYRDTKKDRSCFVTGFGEK